MPTELAFAQNAVQGIVISLIFAFIILLIATRNIIQSISSIYCVFIVVSSIIAILQLNGQQLGTAESIAIVILIGFSVDYIVHLSADYMHSVAVTRNDKMRQAYREMGVSITSGAITTFGCGAFLLLGNFTFFKKFALVITCTVAISYCCAMLMFGAMCHAFGPQNDFGTFCKKKHAGEVRKGQEE